MFVLKEIKASIGCKEKNRKLQQKTGSVGVMVHFCVQVQDVHHIVDLCCAFSELVHL
jgi:hypothetical protein